MISTWGDTIAVDEPAKLVQVTASLMPREIRAEVEHNAVMRMPAVANDPIEWLAAYKPGAA